ncbi:energy transducer TonB [Olivibacter sitiensis]|uniref:energy transducer TonB n=1 Tax=Olivibacter sitiensis TaxID=376470 RepID=UPI0004026217|nr:energy transducer TonB [Olivibacter sitiensis]
MLGSKLDIFNKEWLDVVFEGRNKAYGAYDLRNVSSKLTTRALFLGVGIFVLLMVSPIIAKYLKGKDDAPPPPQELIETEVVLSEPPPVDESTPPPPPPVEPPPPRVDQVRMPPPKVVPAEKVRDEEPPTQEELKVATPGPKTVKGDPTANIAIDVPVGEGPKDAQITEAGSGNTLVDFQSVEIQPVPPGGSLEAFYKWIGANYNYPQAAKENGVNGQVIVQFVVERDGSLTDIKVLRDLKYGTGDEAVRMLKKSGKWKPGVQNGRPVRVSYSLPIRLNLQGQ